MDEAQRVYVVLDKQNSSFHVNIQFTDKVLDPTPVGVKNPTDDGDLSAVQLLPVCAATLVNKHRVL